MTVKRRMSPMAQSPSVSNIPRINAFFKSNQYLYKKNFSFAATMFHLTIISQFKFKDLVRNNL